MAELLRKIVDRNHCLFVDHIDSWQKAVELSTKPLVDTGYVAGDYYQQIVNCITKYGPYVVFEHQVAMPHSTENAEGVYKTAVSFMRVKEPVSFGCDEEGKEKTANLFFTLAAENPEEHLENMSNLCGIFTNEPLLDALMESDSVEDVLAADEKFPCEGF